MLPMSIVVRVNWYRDIGNENPKTKNFLENLRFSLQCDYY